MTFAFLSSRPTMAGDLARCPTRGNVNREPQPESPASLVTRGAGPSSSQPIETVLSDDRHRLLPSGPRRLAPRGHHRCRRVVVIGAAGEIEQDVVEETIDEEHAFADRWLHAGIRERPVVDEEPRPRHHRAVVSLAPLEEPAGELPPLMADATPIT